MNRNSYRGINELYNEDNQQEIKQQQQQQKEQEEEEDNHNFIELFDNISTSNPTTSTTFYVEEILIHFKNEIIQINISNLTQFNEFDLWIRRRFGITSEENVRIIYLNDKGQEIIPNFSLLKATKSYQIFVKIENNIISNSDSDSTACEENKKITKSNNSNNRTRKTFEWLDILSFSYLFPILSLIYLLIFLSPSNPLPNPMNYFSIISPFMTFLGIEKEVQLSLYREMLCTFISWPVPYFFIRRSLNSDFGLMLSFTKFGSDSFWGALAAVFLVLLRHFVKSNLTGMS